MPELPEVESVARGLRRAALGSRVQAVRCHFPAVLETDPEVLKRTLRGRTLDEVGRHGKYLFLVFSGPRVVALHLRMTGQLYLAPLDTAPDKHTHLELLLGGRPDKLVYRDVRKFGRLLLLDSSAEEFLRERGLGPDALRVSTARLRRSLAATSRGLKAALLDQKLVAGLGNIYTDEVLFRVRIHPLRPARSLSAEEVSGLLREVRSLLRAAVARDGTTVSDFVTAAGSAGGYQSQLQVYGRGGEPCPRCGEAIRRIRAAGRGSYFCPRCQVLPG